MCLMNINFKSIRHSYTDLFIFRTPTVLDGWINQTEVTTISSSTLYCASTTTITAPAGCQKTTRGGAAIVNQTQLNQSEIVFSFQFPSP